MPYGLLGKQGIEWDVKYTKDELETSLGYIIAHNSTKDFVVSYYVHWSQLSELMAVLMAKGAHVKLLHVYKPEQNSVGMGFVTASELLVLAFFGKITEQGTDNETPRTRHAVLFATTINKYTHSDGQVGNQTEKPAHTTDQLARRVFGNCTGKHAVVIGSGAGGCAIGFAMAGMSVTAIENNIRQTQVFRARLTAIQDNPTEEKAEVERQRAFVKNISNFTCRDQLIDTKEELKRVVTRNLPWERGRDQVLESIDNAWKDVVIGETNCAACAQIITAQYTLCHQCGQPTCPGCIERCVKEEHSFCSKSCLDTHTCGENADEKSAEAKDTG